MIDEESINDFSGKLWDIANELFALGERISKEGLFKRP